MQLHMLPLQYRMLVAAAAVGGFASCQYSKVVLVVCSPWVLMPQYQLVEAGTELGDSVYTYGVLSTVHTRGRSLQT